MAASSHRLIFILYAHHDLSMVDLKPVTFWEHLVWMDTANYGGVKELQIARTLTPAKRVRRKTRAGGAILDSDGSASDASGVSLGGLSQSKSTLDNKLVMNWNIRNFLPLADDVNCQEWFDLAVAEWINSCCHQAIVVRQARIARGISRVSLLSTIFYSLTPPPPHLHSRHFALRR